MFTAGKMGDAYLAAAAFERERLAAVRTDNGLTIELRREAEQLEMALVATLEGKAQLSYNVAGLDLDSRLVTVVDTGYMGLKPEAVA